jgi:roadblock/LC7 domain-containing protein
MILIGSAVAAWVFGGFAGSLTSDDTMPPAQQDSSVSPFVDTWTSTDPDGSTQTMTIRASGEDAFEITVHDDLASMSFSRRQNGKYERVVKDLCSGSPATVTGTGRIHNSTRLVIPSPVLTCDDGSEPKFVDGLPPIEDYLSDLTFDHDPEPDILTDSSSIGRGLASFWGRAEAVSLIGDVDGWITRGNKRGIWAVDVASPGHKVRLSSTSGTPIEWSRDGSRLLVSAVGLNEPDLFVLDSDGTKTPLANAGGLSSGSFSPDGETVVYEGDGADYSAAIVVADAEGGPPELLLAPGRRPIPNLDDPGADEQTWRTALQQPRWSPDGSLIAYFDGMGDWGHSLRVMDSDGTDVRVVVENDKTLGAGHVYGLQWSPDGSQLAFSIEGRLYVVGVDGSDFRLVAHGVDPYWSPDGSHIAYTRSIDGPESLEIVKLENLRPQNFGTGVSGPWTAELQW